MGKTILCHDCLQVIGKCVSVLGHAWCTHACQAKLHLRFVPSHGSAEIEMGASHLKEIVNLIREHNKKEKQVPLREPDLLMVITGGEMAYTREDGVKVIPLACLKW